MYNSTLYFRVDPVGFAEDERLYVIVKGVIVFSIHIFSSLIGLGPYESVHHNIPKVHPKKSGQPTLKSKSAA